MAKSRRGEEGRSRGVGRPAGALDTETFAGLVAHNVRRLRKRWNMSVAECADCAKISTPHWYRIEQGIYPQAAGACFDLLVEFFEVRKVDLVRGAYGP